eukprot:8929836-Pyramimonas_sp.AAC.1
MAQLAASSSVLPGSRLPPRVDGLEDPRAFRLGELQQSAAPALEQSPKGLACSGALRLAIAPLVGDVSPPGALLEVRVADLAAPCAGHKGRAALLGGPRPPARAEPVLDRGGADQ